MWYFVSLSFLLKLVYRFGAEFMEGPFSGVCVCVCVYV